MSKLTKFQIYAMIERLGISLRRYRQCGNQAAAKRTEKKLDQYRKELAERKEA
jgi:hypothetical protein